MSDIQNTSVSTTVSTSIDRTETAYHASLADILAVPEAGMIPITLDAVGIATSMFGILPELKALRGQIATTWREFNLERFDKLEQYALALTHAHGIHNRLSKPRPDVTEKAAELTKLRDRLYTLAVPLVDFGLIAGSEIAKCKVAIGYRALIEDVITLVGIYRERWPDLAGKIPLTEEEVLRAKNLALELMELVGLREQGPASVSEAALIRQKAFTLFLRSYEEARRAVTYLRGEQGDADQIAPSFYSLRNAKRRGSEEGPLVPESAATPEGAEPTATPSAPAVLADKTPAPPAPITINNPAGFPVAGGPFSN